MQNASVSLDGKLGAAIAAVEARLRELDSERGAAARELAELLARRERAISAGSEEDGEARAASWTPQRKLVLFAGLFRGREEVFPRRWEKPAKGKSGWAPRCENEWKAGVCGKPRVKCGECPNQAFRAPAESELLGHLQGRHVMGVYPLLADDTCRLLAIDLDERSWRADVVALRGACRELDLTPAVERSRSGEGAEPFEDQWSYLQALPGIAPARLEELVALGSRDGRVLGVPEEAENGDVPWRPARPLADRLATAELPDMVSATLAQRLYVHREGLPPVLLDALRLAAFSNPKFLELQAMRMSTARTPRVIACFEQTGRFLALPRGCRCPWRNCLPV